MALELVKLINCNVADSDQDKINNLLDGYLCGSSNESDTDSDSESEICNSKSSDEDDDLDDRRNTFEDAVAAESVEIVMDSVDEELKTVTSFRYVCQQLLYTLSNGLKKYILSECRLFDCDTFCLHEQCKIM